MKAWRMILLLLAFSLIWNSCDDDEEDNSLPGSEQDLLKTELAGASFGLEAKTVLKNSGCLELPLVLDRMAAEPVKITIGIKESIDEGTAREGMDFEVQEKVVNIQPGDTVSYLQVDILDNKEADGDRNFELVITGVYGGAKALKNAQQCQVSVVSNAFIEFEKQSWQMYESSASSSATNEVQQMRYVPLSVTGDIKESSVLVIGVKDSTASEYIHFNLKEHEIPVEPGSRKVMVEVLPVDDEDANLDRDFGLYIKEIRGGNLIMGKNNLSTDVKIISEEIRKVVSFESAADLNLPDNAKQLYIPIVIDKEIESTVKVQIAASSKSTAEAGKDYILDTPVVEIGSSGRAEMKVTLLNDNEINADRQLILQMISVEGESAYLSDENTVLNINILNDDFATFASEVLEVPEDEDYQLVLNMPAVQRERTVKFSVLEANKYMEISTSPIVVPAGATEVSIPVHSLYNKDFPSGEQLALLHVTEVDGYVLPEPVAVTLKYVKCAYRKRLGTWSFLVGHYSGNGKKFDNLVRTLDFEMLEWKKSFIMKGELLVDWPMEIVVTFDEKTGDALVMNDKPVYTNVSFTGWGRIDCYLKTAVQNDELWSKPFAPLPLKWDENTQTYTWMVSKKFGIRSDCYGTGTKKKPESWGGKDLYWFSMTNLSMTKK